MMTDVVTMRMLTPFQLAGKLLFAKIWWRLIPMWLFSETDAAVNAHAQACRPNVAGFVGGTVTPRRPNRVEMAA